jgi:hypothetical protein
MVNGRFVNFLDVFCNFSIINRWEYSNPAYLDALKFLTDLKEEGQYGPYF